MTDFSPLLPLALAVTTLAASFAAVVLAAAQRRVWRELTALRDTTAGLADLCRRQESQLEAVAERVESERVLAAAQGAAAGRAYELAARLASGGAGSAQLVASCGLTPAEADLAVRVHRARSVAGAA